VLIHLCYPPTLQFPYYTFVDKSRMYTVGSLFYAIYFFVSFPMFFRVDEDVRNGHKWTLQRVAIDRCVTASVPGLKEHNIVPALKNTP